MEKKNPPLLDKNFDLKFNKLFLKLLFKKKKTDFDLYNAFFLEKMAQIHHFPKRKKNPNRQICMIVYG
jgi:hypothetical protein